MSFASYIQTAHRRLNDFEDDLDAEWERHETWLERNEKILRVALLVLLLRWPFDRRGRLDGDEKPSIRDIRSTANDRIRRFERIALEHFVGRERADDGGTTGAPDLDPRGPRGLEGLLRSRRQSSLWRAYKKANETANLLEEKSRKLLVDIGRDIGLLPPPGAPAAPPEAPKDDRKTEDQKDWIDQAMKEVEALGIKGAPDDRFAFVEWFIENQQKIDLARERAAEEREAHPEESDLPENSDNGVSNPAANVRYESRRWVEQLKDLSMGRPSRAEIVEHVNGSADPRATAAAHKRPGGMAMNRNNLRLSTEAHLRATYRSELFRAFGPSVDHWILEAPASRIPDLSPAGVLARELHQVRTREEWGEIMRRLNQARRTTATFEGLGFHHGDFSMPIPVPKHLLRDALEYSKSARAALARRIAA